MLDFNDTAPAPEIPASERREAVRAALLAGWSRCCSPCSPLERSAAASSSSATCSAARATAWKSCSLGTRQDCGPTAPSSGGDVFHLIGAHFGVDVHGDFARVLDLAEDLAGERPACARRQRPRSTTSARPPPSGTTSTHKGSSSPWVHFDPPGRKGRPWDAKRRKMAPPEPRPLYNQPGIRERRPGRAGRGRSAPRP